MRRIIRRVLAVLLIASPLALASIIHNNPEDVLNRPVESFDPTPQFGPKLHLTEGPEIVVYPRSYQQEGVADMFSVWAAGVALAAALFSMIPRFQRALLLLRLLD